LHKALQNGLVQITCFYWITYFSELRQEPLEAGQSQLGGFEIHQIFFKKFSFEKRANSKGFHAIRLRIINPM
jgi:hypothetical protein